MHRPLLHRAQHWREGIPRRRARRSELLLLLLVVVLGHTHTRGFGSAGTAELFSSSTPLFLLLGGNLLFILLNLPNPPVRLRVAVEAVEVDEVVEGEVVAEVAEGEAGLEAEEAAELEKISVRSRIMGSMAM